MVLLFKGGGKVLYKPKFKKRVYTQPIPDYGKMETFEQIKNKAWQISESMSPGTFHLSDYADFEGTAPGEHPQRGSAAAEAKPVRGLNPASRGTKF